MLSSLSETKKEKRYLPSKGLRQAEISSKILLPPLPTLKWGLGRGGSWLQPFHHSAHCMHLSCPGLALPSPQVLHHCFRPWLSIATTGMYGRLLFPLTSFHNWLFFPPPLNLVIVNVLQIPQAILTVRFAQQILQHRTHPCSKKASKARKEAEAFEIRIFYSKFILIVEK